MLRCTVLFLQDAHNNFIEWLKKFEGNKPSLSMVSKQSGMKSFADSVAAEQCEKLYQTELERWHHTVNLTKEVIYGILL